MAAIIPSQPHVHKPMPIPAKVLARRRQRARANYPDIALVLFGAAVITLLALVQIRLNGLIQAETLLQTEKRAELASLADMAREREGRLQASPEQVEAWAVAHHMEPPSMVVPVAPDASVAPDRSAAVQQGGGPAAQGSSESPAVLNAFRGLVDGFRTLVVPGTPAK